MEAQPWGLLLLLPVLSWMVSWSNEAETLHTLEDAPLEQSGSASGLGRICPLTFWRLFGPIECSCVHHQYRNIFKCKLTLRAPRSTQLRIWTVRAVWWRTKAVGVTYGVFVLFKCVFLAHFQGLITILLVYIVLFDTNGAHNRGSLRVDRGGNVEIEFGACGWIPIATEVCVCIWHWVQHKYLCVEAVAKSVIHPQSVEFAPVLWGWVEQPRGGLGENWIECTDRFQPRV